MGTRNAFIFSASKLAFSASLGDAFKTNFQKFHGQTTIQNFTPNDSSSWKAGVDAILRQYPSLPDLVFCACYAADFKLLNQQIQQYPTEFKAIQLMGGSALGNLQGRDRIYRSFSFVTTAFSDTIQYRCTDDPSCTSEQIGFYATYCQRFASATYDIDPAHYLAHCQTYGSSRPSKDVMLSYDALDMLLLAYQNARYPTDPQAYEKVREQLQNVAFQGLTGWIQMKQGSSTPVNKMVLVVQVGPAGTGESGTGGIAAYYGRFTQKQCFFYSQVAC